MPILSNIPPQRHEQAPNFYERAVNLMRLIARNGFADKGELPPEYLAKLNGDKYLYVPLDNTDLIPSRLVVMAAVMTEPKASSAFNDTETEMQLFFPGDMEKPPIRAMRSNLERLRDYFFNECIDRHQEATGYFVFNPGKEIINPIRFAMAFVEPGETVENYYRLPTGTDFIDKNGNRHDDTKLVTSEVFEQYLDKHHPDYLDKTGPKLVIRVLPTEIMIPPQVMQRMMDSMGAGLEKGRLAS